MPMLNVGKQNNETLKPIYERAFEAALARGRKKLTPRVHLSVALAQVFEDYFARKIRNPVFVIGCGRSGKTLLAKALSHHTEIAFWNEANEVLDPRGYPWYKSGLETPPMECDPVSFTARWWRDTQMRQKRLVAMFGAYQWLSRGRYIVNDSHMNTFRIPHLLEMFPNARFIHMVRDGRAVVYEYAVKLHNQMTGVWSDSYESKGLQCSFDDLLLRLSRFWRDGIAEVSRRDREMALGQRGILMELTFEELCAEPAGSLERVTEFLGLKPDRTSDVGYRPKVSTQDIGWWDGLGEDMAAKCVAELGPAFHLKGYGGKGSSCAK